MCSSCCSRTTRSTSRYDEAIGTTYAAVHDDAEAALSTIVDRYHRIDERFDAIVIVGSDYTDVGSPTELGFNARVAANLGASVLLVLGGRDPETDAPRTADELRQLAEVTTAELTAAHASIAGVIVNRADPGAIDGIPAAIADAVPAEVPVWSIPEDALLSAPSVGTLFRATDAELVRGDPELLQRESLGTVVAGMSMEHVLERLIEGGILVMPGDRSDVVVGTLLAQQSDTFPSIAGIVLNGGFELHPAVQRLLDGLDLDLPIGRSPHGTYETARRIATTRGSLIDGTQRKRDAALALFDEHVDADALLERLEVATSDVVTPLIFEHSLIERARADVRHIVLPEGEDDRILQAASTVLARGIARLTILGDEAAIRQRAAALGLDLAGRPHRRDRRCRAATALRRRVPAAARAQGRHDRAGHGAAARRLLLRHAHGAHGRRRRHGVGRGAHDRAHDQALVRDHQDEAGRLGRLERLPHGALRPRARLRRLRRHPGADRRGARRHRRSRRRRPRATSASSRASRCSRTRPASRAPAPRSTACGRRPSSCASARPSCSSRVRCSTTRRRMRRWRRRRCPTRRWRGARPCSSSPTSTPATTPTRRCSAPPGRSRSGRCCRASTSRSTTSRAVRS